MNRSLPFLSTLTCLTLAFLGVPTAEAQDVRVLNSARHNTTTTALRDIARDAPLAPLGGAPYAVPNKFMRFGDTPGLASNDVEDLMVQNAAGTGSATILQNFDGSNDDDNAAAFGFRLVPPDTQGDVGPNHYVQWINLVAEIFDKDGNTILGPFPGNLFFAGLGGLCENTNDGDPIVLYDEGADRWLVSQFALDFDNTNFSMCIGISATPDPTGGYHQYELNFGTIFPDYPKLGIWGDSYTMTTRNFIGASGQFAIVMDRDAMLNGDPGTALAAFIPRFFFEDGLLPMDSDTPDISGPALFGGHTAFGSARGDKNQVFRLYAFDVDWDNPGTATFTTLPSIDIPDYQISGPAYVVQPNGEALADLETFTMHRAQVRDFGTHRSMVANHTVKAKADAAGVRWYEFRDYGSGWGLHQSGTYSPDSDDRWMASIAMNGNGEIALGYSRTGKTLHPSIYVTGQTADYSGTGIMNVAETPVIIGGGSQVDSNNRWGDYSMMSVDPSDDETFWYTQEYYAETGSFDFNTRIAAFRLDGGGASKGGVAASETPTTFGLEQNYPNPFNPATTITYTLAEDAAVSLRVFDVLGKEVATLVDGYQEAGDHRVGFNALHLSAGVYLYVLRAGPHTQSRRMTLLK